MTQKQIDEHILYLAKLEYITEARRKDLKAAQITEDKYRLAFRESCDHLMPDKSSADNGNYMYGSCSLCGEFDI
jgi:hypothetical protein